MCSNFSIIALVSKISIGMDSPFSNKINLIPMYFLSLVGCEVLILAFVLDVLMIDSLHIMSPLDVG